jgi:branched-chain amino acid transport system substrate-binding protein
MRRRGSIAATILLSAVMCGGVSAQDTVKVGVVLPLTGPFTSTGNQILSGARLYLEQHGATPAGKTLELVVKDDAAVADQTRRIVQELITRDKVSIIAGFGLTPLAFAAAPLATQTKTPMIVMGAATSSVTERSPFIVRTSFAQAQSPVVLAEWMAKNGIRKVVSMVSDFAPGHEAEAAFKERLVRAGGQIVESVRVPLQNPDFAPFLQRTRDASPEAIFVFVPAGQAAALMKQFAERGMAASGIKLYGAGDITDDEVLNGMGDVTLGVITAYHYSADHQSDQNKKFVDAFKKANNGLRPNFFGVAGYDGMHLISEVLKKTGGRADAESFVSAANGMRWESPRGPMSIDPDTRDVIHNIYLRKVERKNGELYNVEFETVPDVKDPVKATKAQ